MTRSVLRHFVAGLLLAASCTDSAGAPRLVVRYRPTDLSAESFDNVSLFWTHPPGEASGGYTVEARAVPEPFTVLKPLDFSQLSFSYRFDESAPEATNFEFRVRALPEAGALRASNVVSIRRGVRPPRLHCTGNNFTCLPINGGFQLEWSNRSQVADGFALERRILRFGEYTFREYSGDPRVWSKLPVAYPATSYFDTDLAGWSDAAQFAYRLAALKGSERSIIAEVQWTSAAPLLAPRSVAATALDPGIRITFENASRVANHIHILRATVLRGTLLGPGLLASLPVAGPSTTSSFDDVSVFPGLYEYTVRAAKEDLWLPPVLGAGAKVTVLVPPAGLSANLVSVPPGSVAVRNASGAFGTAGALRGSSGAPFLIAPGDSSSPPLALPSGSLLSRPGVVLDAAGNPHAVYAEPVAGTTGSAALVHVWHDSQGWQREEIARRDFLPLVRFDIALDGTLIASWSSPSTLEVARRVNGGWMIENVAAALGPAFQTNWTNHFLTGDEGGAAHVIAVAESGASASHIFRDVGGWRSEALPAPFFSSRFPTREDGMRVVAGTGRIAIAYQEVGTSSSWFVYLVERTAQGWRQQNLMFTRDGYIATLEAARSADGSRIAVTAEASNGLGQLWLLRAGSTTLNREWFNPGSRSAVGFRSDGKAWILAGLEDSAPPGGSVRALLFEEP